MSANKPPAALSGNPLSPASSRRRSLEERLAETKLQPEDIATEVTKQVRKSLTEALVGLLPGGEAAKSILSIASETDDALKQKKLEFLIGQYFNRTDKTEDSVEKLGYLVTSPWGNALFSKIVRIVEDSPPDGELLNHLAAALTHITNSNFEDLFSEHKFALAQIEQLSPQALSLIADHERWPAWVYVGIIVQNDIVTSPWHDKFSSHYAPAARMNAAEQQRLTHSIYELRSRGLAEAISEKDAEPGKPVVRARLTTVAHELLKYLDRPGQA